MKIMGALVILISLFGLVWATHELSVGGQFDLEGTVAIAFVFPFLAPMILLPLLLPIVGIVIGIVLLIQPRRKGLGNIYHGDQNLSKED